MAHAFLQQYLEILPLDGTGILELVYHDMLQLGANLFKNERRVAVLDEFVQELLRIAKEESVCLAVHLPYFPFDMIQKPELIQVTQGEVCRFEQFPLARTGFNGLA